MWYKYKNTRINLQDVLYYAYYLLNDYYHCIIFRFKSNNKESILTLSSDEECILELDKIDKILGI